MGAGLIQLKYLGPEASLFVGNPQILPSPTAEPEAAIRKPNLDENSPRASDIV